jgi:hypothetical protein
MPDHLIIDASRVLVPDPLPPLRVRSGSADAHGDQRAGGPGAADQRRAPGLQAAAGWGGEGLMAGIDHNHTNYPVCPYCGHVDKDPSEIDFSSSEVAEVTCGECDMDYTLIQHIKITFTSKP